METFIINGLLRRISVFSRQFYVTFFLCCLLAHQNAVTSQNETTTQEVKVTSEKQDNNVVLTCTVQNIGTRKVVWTKLSEPYPIAVGSTRFTLNKKFSVKAKKDGSVLTIKNIQVKDSGEYQCRLTGPHFAADLLTLTVKGGEDSIYLVPTETSVKAPIGSTVTLPCEIKNMNLEAVLWKSSSGQILSLREKVLAGDTRFRVLHSIAQQWSLSIRNIRESDYDTYTCIVNSDPMLTRSVVLSNSAPTLSSPKLIMDSLFKKRVIVDAGQDVTLTCNFDANPPANVTWSRKKTGQGKSRKERVGEGRVLKLFSVSEEQTGDYICIGDNGIKPFARGKTKLIVQGPPTPAAVLETTTFIPTAPTAPYLFYGKERTGANIGYHATIKCTAFGDPRPDIQWKRNGNKLSNNYKYKIESKPENRHALHSELVIRTLQSNDFGDYECLAWNTLGLKTVTQVLYDSSK